MGGIVMGFVQWLELQGCHVEITQADDGSGYIVTDVTMPDGTPATVTIEVQST
jgi:hypothetical protein